MSEFQTYIKDCGCGGEGVLHFKGKIHCRWCRKPYAKGGLIQYDEEHFPKEKDIPKAEYQIISFYSDMSDGRRNVLSLRDDGMYMFGSRLIGVTATLEDCLKRFEIHSVKRLSDGEVFTIGDKCNYGKDGLLTGFRISNFSGMLCDIDFSSTNSYSNASLMAIEKVTPKVPLFTTEDGVEIFEGNKFWRISTNNDWDCVDYYADKRSGNDRGRGLFSTKVKAKKYILLNKPVLINYKQLKTLFDEYGTYSYESVCAYLEGFFNRKINP